MKHKEQPTIDDCRAAYWAACARYEAHRTDAYSTWRQINDAAADVAIAREAWVRAAEREQREPTFPRGRRIQAVKRVCAETGEDAEWVLNQAKRR